MDDTNTLAEAKAFLRIHRGKGSHCPACGRFDKVYHRTITDSMAEALRLMYLQDRRAPGKPFHMPTLLRDSRLCGDAAKLRWWGLIHPIDPEGKARNQKVGHYVMTMLGRRFVEGEELVARHVIEYHGECEGIRDPNDIITFVEALGRAFDYQELMKEAS